jgi:hypothetical protein
MKFIKKFNESLQNDLSIYNILLYMVDIVDNNEVKFTDVNDKSYESKDINDKTDFLFTKDYHNIQKTKFTISIKNKEGIDFESYVSILDNIVTLKRLLNDEGWLMSTITTSNYYVQKDKDVTFSNVVITFKKPDQQIESTQSLEKNITPKKLVDLFWNYRIEIEEKNIIYYDNHIDIQEWYSEYLDNSQIESELDVIIEKIGSYEWEWFNGSLPGFHTNGIRIYF